MLPATGALSAAESALENAGIRPSAALRLDGNAADLLQSIKDIEDSRGIEFDPATYRARARNRTSRRAAAVAVRSVFGAAAARVMAAKGQNSSAGFCVTRGVT